MQTFAEKHPKLMLVHFIKYVCPCLLFVCYFVVSCFIVVLLCVSVCCLFVAWQGLCSGSFTVASTWPTANPPLILSQYHIFDILVLQFNIFDTLVLQYHSFDTLVLQYYIFETLFRTA